MGSLAQQRGGPHWLSDAWALLTPFPGGPRLRKASRQLAGTELGTREQGAGQAWRSGSRACVHCPRPMGQGTESSAEGARKRASEGFGAEAGLALQLEEEGGSQGKGGGRRRLEVPRSGQRSFGWSRPLRGREPLVLLTLGCVVRHLYSRSKDESVSLGHLLVLPGRVWVQLGGASLFAVCGPAGGGQPVRSRVQAGSRQGVALRWEGLPGARGRGVCGHAGQDAVKGGTLAARPVPVPSGLVTEAGFPSSRLRAGPCTRGQPRRALPPQCLCAHTVREGAEVARCVHCAGARARPGVEVLVGGWVTWGAGCGQAAAVPMPSRTCPRSPRMCTGWSTTCATTDSATTACRRAL